MDARSLSDREILDAMRIGGVLKHPQHGEFMCARRQGERPIEYIERFRGEFGAWYNGKEIEEVSKARATQASNREATGKSGGIIVPPGAAVQAPQASLAETIKAQVAQFRSRLVGIELELEAVYTKTRELCYERNSINRQLVISEKFLKELEEGENTPAVPQKVGKHLHRQVGQRKSGGRSRVGQADSPEVREPESQGGNEKDTGGAGKGSA